MNSSVKTRAQGKPGNRGPAAFAFFCPGPQLGNFTKKISLASNIKPSARPVPTRQSGAEGSDSRFLRSQLRRIGPGRCPQARPCRQRPHPITITSAALAKPELSTLHKIGTFYFALTSRKAATGAKRPLGCSVLFRCWPCQLRSGALRISLGTLAAPGVPWERVSPPVSTHPRDQRTSQRCLYKRCAHRDAYYDRQGHHGHPAIFDRGNRGHL
jgi:hypothetical protein